MRRTLAIISLTLILIGLELSTGAISFTVTRLGDGAAALFAGSAFRISALRYGVGLLTIIMGVLVWAVLFWSARARTGVQAVGHTCPKCGSETRRVRRKRRHRLLAMLMGEALARRQCESCGWVGLSLRS